MIERWSEPRQSDVELTRIDVLLLDQPVPPIPPPPLRPPTSRPQASSMLKSAPARSSPRQPSAATSAVLIPADEPVTADQPPNVRLFAVDGSIVDIEDRVRTLNDRVSAAATFEYQIAGLADAETAFTLPETFQVNATRFDRHWKPNANLADELLERAVKASTVVISIPVPGMPGYRVGCAVVIIAATGSCGLSEPSKLVYDIDDPTTLSAEEARACEIIWEKITTASSQDEHRRLRRIYELGCRLPLAGNVAPEVHPQGFPFEEFK